MSSPAKHVPSVSVHDLGPEDAVARLITFAADLKVSDLFFHTNENHVAVSARHLGLVRLLTLVPAEPGRRCLAHIKAMAGLDVAERRRPLDGRWLHEHNGRKIDLRVSSIPTIYGEDLTLRLLERASPRLDLGQLGLLRVQLTHLHTLLSSPSGLVLVTGPTGSGKTTTLYAALRYLNNGERKLSAIEDPVEYAVEGIRQSQVNPQIGVDFPDLLRSVLRQSADVIMVGEVRDSVTAETAVWAANSGHMVLATLHAPISAGAIQSMIQLGVRPNLLASSLRGVVAQRLVRTLCPDCKTTFELAEAPETFNEVRRWLEPEEGRALCAARGCQACLGSGYRDRTGVFELMTVTPALRKLIAAGETSAAIQQKAVAEGLLEFRLAAMLKVARGETTVEEVLRVVPTEFLGLET
jgi:type II secretory ATPase GspE/PulE/Tfp pilus assembly ATPase PilB-like protein